MYRSSLFSPSRPDDEQPPFHGSDRCYHGERFRLQLQRRLESSRLKGYHPFRNLPCLNDVGIFHAPLIDNTKQTGQAISCCQTVAHESFLYHRDP